MALFNVGLLTAMTQTLAWCVIFFFASAGASAAYRQSLEDIAPPLAATGRGRGGNAEAEGAASPTP